MSIGHARDLHELPRFDDRWTHLYLEHGRVDVDASSLSFMDARGLVPIPIDHLALLMLGPGTTITHAAVKALAENACLVCWVGEQGVRTYAHGTGGTFQLLTACCARPSFFCNDEQRQIVARRMYSHRFPDPPDPKSTIEQLRGMEGARVRAAYRTLAESTGVSWQGRSYKQGQWDWADPLNRALSCASSCLYGLCHSAIVAAGYSAAIGFIHTGKLLSFVYDIADLYKTEVTIPVAFRTVKEGPEEIERRVRLACRDAFHATRLIERILPDIAKVLDDRDGAGESPAELEGRIITLADRDPDGSLRGPYEPEDPREAVG